MINIIINNVWSRLSGFKDVDIVDALDKETSFYVEGYQFTRAFREGYYNKKLGYFTHWDGKKHLLTQKMVFPTGLLKRITDFLDLRKIPYEINDSRHKPKPGKKKIKHFVPRDYQQEALKAAIKNERGIIRIGTGGGKTICAAMIAAHYDLPTMIYVIGKDLLYQFHKEVQKSLGVKIGIIGDGHCDIRKINICSVWTAATAFNLKSKVSLDDEDWCPEIIAIGTEEKRKLRKAIENVNVSIYDEAHFLATDTLQSIFKASKKCRYHFGLSGTDWRDDGADLLLESICGKRIYNMPSSRLIENGYLVVPKIVLLEIPHQELPAHYQTVYKNYITENDFRNSLIVDAARKLIARKRRLLILVRYLSHGKKLASMLSDLSIFFVNGEVDGQTRQDVKQAFEDGELECLIASSVYDLGVDIPSLDALILAGGGKSTVRALQRVGRVIRNAPDKEDALVVDFIDNARYLIKHSATRIAVYETEPKFMIKFPQDFDSASIKRPKRILKKIGQFA
jgi:superfamily II DNA or RNA helicase